MFLDATQDHQSFVAVVDHSLYSLFQEGDHHIAQLELAMILYGLLARPAQFRGRRGIWFVDNTAARIDEVMQDLYHQLYLKSGPFCLAVPSSNPMCILSTALLSI